MPLAVKILVGHKVSIVSIITPTRVSCHRKHPILWRHIHLETFGATLLLMVCKCVTPLRGALLQHGSVSLITAVGGASLFRA